MTTRQFKVIFYLILGLCILTMVLSFKSFDFIEVDTAVNWTMKYFALPILVCMVPSCIFIYLKFIRQHETKEYNSRMWTRIRTIFRIFFMTFGLTGILTGTTLSLIILTNAYIGEHRTINLNAKIIDYYSLKSKGRIRHHIKIQDPQLDRIIDLKVQEPYQIGQTFNKSILIGKWGLLYSEK